jgi:hypothetical protein
VDDVQNLLDKAKDLLGLNATAAVNLIKDFGFNFTIESGKVKNLGYNYGDRSDTYRAYSLSLGEKEDVGDAPEKPEEEPAAPEEERVTESDIENERIVALAEQEAAINKLIESRGMDVEAVNSTAEAYRLAGNDLQEYSADLNENNNWAL